MRTASKLSSRLVGSVLLAAVWMSGTSSVSRPAEPKLEGEAFRQLEMELLHRKPGMSAEQASRLLEENFRHLYANCVNESRFLVKPSGYRIASVTLELLRQQRELGDILRESRGKLTSRADSAGERAASLRLGLIREARRKGRRIRDTFRDTFLETSQGSFQMTLARNEETAFLTFVIEGERINRLLGQEMERYFFGAKPGVVAVRDYDRASIPVLGEALTLLAKTSEEHLRR